MKLWAISDLHVRHPGNRGALETLGEYPDDWLIVAGDVCERATHFETALAALRARFARVIWVPGNHELWALPEEEERGEAKYHRLVDICRRLDVVTPEDPYPLWTGPGGAHVVAPLFTLYDYGFRPADVPLDAAVEWARAGGVVCADEFLLRADPYPSRAAWCARRCAWTEARLVAASAEHRGPMVLVNHFPLREELAVLPRIPRFSIWCGTPATADWHRRFRASVVVSGHLHMRQTRVIDGTRFEEVSLGYPHQWDGRRGLGSYLRQILPAPDAR